MASNDTATAEKISFLRGLAGVVAAILFYLVGTVILAVGISIPLLLIGLAQIPILTMIQSVVVAIGAIWFARSATDWTLKRYSGRAVFVVFLAVMLVMGTAFAMRLPLTAELGSAFVQMIAVVGAAYFWFWRRESETAEMINARREKAMTSVGTVLGCLPGMLYFGYGLIQYSAVVAQVRSFTHLNGFISAALAFLLSYFPIVGSVIGFFGAKDVWGWHWWQAALLYLGLPIGMYVVLMVGSLMYELAKSAFRPKTVA